MRTVEEQRQAVWTEALTWLRTPWHHEARAKGAGVDCAQLVIAAYVGAGVIADFSPGQYPRDWHIHKTVERFLSFVPRFAVEIDPGRAAMGDLILFRIGRVYSHGAIIGTWPQGIHADIGASMVTLCDFDRDSGLISSDRKFFTHKDWL